MDGEYLVEREITANDIRAKILVIPQIIKSMLEESAEQFPVVFCGIEKKLNIDKQRRYFGGITEFYRRFGLLTDDGTSISKKAKWKIADGKIIIDIMQGEQNATEF